MVKQLRAAVIFDNFGPYHLARLRAASAQVDLLAIEVRGQSREYAWESSRAAEPFQQVTLENGENAETLKTEMLKGKTRQPGASELRELVTCHLCTFAPSVVFIPGWSSPAAFFAMQWCVANAVPAVLMSESTAHDEARSGWREAVKRRYVCLASAALVGGTPHADYLAQLGMPRERSFPGYDAVDNDYFAQGADTIRLNPDSGILTPAHQSVHTSSLKPHTFAAGPYFLASARFIEKKNLPFLLRAYARYRTLALARAENAEKLKSGNAETQVASDQISASQPVSISGFGGAWPLILLGDGPLRSILESLISSLSLRDSVALPGFIQYPELPRYYAGAGAFIHASTTEQWGLVVNEAMASRLPVLVSNRCGCAPDLVQEGVNGWTFDPTNEEQLAQLMLRISAFQDFSLSAFGSASRQIISQWGPDRFAVGLRQAAECALRVGPKRVSLVDRALLALLARR